MPKQIEFEGAIHEFPDDFSDADIGSALESVGTSPSAQANRALAGTGIRVAGRTPPALPAEKGAPDYIKGMYNAKYGAPRYDAQGNSIDAPPELGRGNEGPGNQIAAGVAGLATPGSRVRGASNVLRGAVGAMSGPENLGPAMAAAPITTPVAIGTGMAAQKLTTGGLKMAGASDDWADLGGDVAGIAAGATTATYGPRVAPVANKTLKGVAQGATESLKVSPSLTKMANSAIPGAVRGGIEAYREATAPPTTPTEITGSAVNVGRNAPPPEAPPKAEPPFKPGAATKRNMPAAVPFKPQYSPPAPRITPRPVPDTPLTPQGQAAIEPAPVPFEPFKPSPRTKALARFTPGGTDYGTPSVSSRNSAIRRPAPTPEVVDAEAGPPAPPSALPAQGPPAPKQNFAFEGGETAPAGKPTKESVIKGHQTVRAKALARKLKIEGRDIDRLPPLGDPKWEGIAKSAGTTVPSSPESYQMVIDEYKKLPPGGDMPEFARGGVVTPKNQKLRTSRRGNLFGPPQLLRQIRAESGPPQPTS